MTNSVSGTRPANHHYVPRFYLKGFIDRAQYLWVYEKGFTAPRRSTPKKEGHREEFYSSMDQGCRDTSTEESLSKAESLVAPVVRKLANPQFEVTDQQRAELYSFIALMFVRVPTYRAYIDERYGDMMKDRMRDLALDRDAFYALINAHKERTGERVVDPEKVRQFALAKAYTVTQGSAGFNLFHTFRSSLAISNILEAEYQYDIFYAPQDSPFITCDNPVVTFVPNADGSSTIGMGFSLPGTLVLFPLNKGACMILSRTGAQKRMYATPYGVQQINDLVMAVAQNLAYASSGTSRLGNIFNERGCKIEYGENAFVAMPRGS